MLSEKKKLRPKLLRKHIAMSRWPAKLKWRQSSPTLQRFKQKWITFVSKRAPTFEWQGKQELDAALAYFNSSSQVALSRR